MASPAASASAKASSAVSSLKQTASQLKEKADAMKKQAEAQIRNASVNSALNIEGQLASKLGGIVAAGILSNAIPGKILPTLAGAAYATQIINNVSQLLKAAKKAGNKKSGQPEDEADAEAKEQKEKKQEAISKAEEKRNKKLEEKRKAASSVVAKK